MVNKPAVFLCAYLPGEGAARADALADVWQRLAVARGSSAAVLRSSAGAPPSFKEEGGKKSKISPR